MNPYKTQTLDSEVTLFWHRRDLRTVDNVGLYHALKEQKRVLPLFIFDTEILNSLPKKDKRVEFIHQSLQVLKAWYEEQGSSLLVLFGNPVELFSRLVPKAVYSNHDYEPYARNRDQKVAEELKTQGIAFKTYKDQVIFEKDEVIKDDGKPYTVFTPYSKRWKKMLETNPIKKYDLQPFLKNLLPSVPLALLGLAEIGFQSSSPAFPERIIKTAIIDQYEKQRNFPALHGTTRLSVHIRFGTVSIRQLTEIAVRRSAAWLNELIWRDFYAMILWHFPEVVDQAFKPAYDRIQWRNNEQEFQAWCEGRTGYPIVDAGMRELNETGFMHNRVRMITASFLTKHLLVDWRWGEAYFAEKLLDFDLASNNGGWQWAAGSGCDAAPYFRVFNPELQTQKFDPELKYVKKWVPEFQELSYPRPMVEHSFARERALNTYKQALSK